MTERGPGVAAAPGRDDALGELPVLTDLLRASFRKHRRITAIEFEGHSLSYAEIDSASNRIARAVGGLARDDAGPMRVALLAENSPAAVTAYVGLVKASCVVIPLNSRLAPEEVATIASTARCRLLLHDAATLELAAAASRLANIRCLAVDDVRVLDESDSEPSQIVKAVANTLVAMPFTSGTTGGPKGVLLTARNLVSSMVNGAIAFGFVPGMRNVVYQPLSFHAVMVGHVLTPLWLGGTILLRRSFNAIELADLVCSGQVDFVSHVPTSLQRVVAALGNRSVPHTVTHFVGAAPIPREVLKAHIQRLGTVLQGWGLTEATNIVSCTNRQDLARGTESPDADALTCGHVLPNSELMILEETGEVKSVTPGIRGEALVGGSTVAAGYWNSPIDDGVAFKDSWLHTGDIVEVNAGGCIRVVGRRKELINTGGMKVAPGELESILFTHSGIDDVAVLGIPDEEWGEVVVAAVVPKPGERLDAEQIRDFARQHLAGYKCPRQVVFVETLPRTASGKVAKAELRVEIAKRVAGADANDG